MQELSEHNVGGDVISLNLANHGLDLRTQGYLQQNGVTVEVLRDNKLFKVALFLLLE